MSVRAVTFWASAAGTGWIVGGYPATLAVLPRRRWRRAATEPTVTLIVPAYRERDALRVKLSALQALDYPPERLQVIVCVDEDRELVEIAKGAFPGAEVLFEERRAGKAAAVNRALERARGDIVVLTDANNVLAPASLRASTSHFADARVWAVAGRRGEAGSAYDRYEDLLRRLETRSGSVAAASGEFIAVRRERLPALPDDVVNDDLWLLCQLVRAGGRVVYEPQARSQEGRIGAAAERERRARIGAGRVLLLNEIVGLPPAYVVRLLSHKFGRLALPFLLLLALASSLALADRSPYRRLALAQSGFYLVALAAPAPESGGGPVGAAVRMARQFALGNVAIALGVARGLRGGQDVSWTPVR